jgi:hypothetical protein
MTRKRKIFFLSVAVLLTFGASFLIYCFLVIVPDNATQNQYSHNAHEIGIALTVYANDHHGRLPFSFEELVPEIMRDRAIFDNMTLVAPGISLNSVPLNYVVARQSQPSRRGNIAVVTADGGMELRREY